MMCNIVISYVTIIIILLTILLVYIILYYLFEYAFIHQNNVKYGTNNHYEVNPAILQCNHTPSEYYQQVAASFIIRNSRTYSFQLWTLGFPIIYSIKT